MSRVVLVDQALGHCTVDRLDSGFIGGLGGLTIRIRSSGFKLLDAGLESGAISLVAGSVSAAIL